MAERGGGALSRAQKVHHFRTGMGNQAWMRREDFRFGCDPARLLRYRPVRSIGMVGSCCSRPTRRCWFTTKKMRSLPTRTATSHGTFRYEVNPARRRQSGRKHLSS